MSDKKTEMLRLDHLFLDRFIIFLITELTCLVINSIMFFTFIGNKFIAAIVMGIFLIESVYFGTRHNKEIIDTYYVLKGQERKLKHNPLTYKFVLILMVGLTLCNLIIATIN